ncbi:HAD family hydrolase [Pontiella sp.]|uniref:HAD family hydrolase n=1 Tax=Pontiella sp. TaxID=2837462 RepID=UPI0035686AF9
MTKDRYLFCDIDGTLLYAKGSGRPAFGAAFFDAFGIEISVDHINFAGATDLGVLAQLAGENRQELTPETTALFFERLAVYLDENMTKWPPIVFPGVEHFLQRVSRQWKLALVSGNIRATAYMKLRHGGLEHYFTDIGGFGDDDARRSSMAALALERAGHPAGAFLLGDTPSDIAAAKANGMISVAVCNGQFSREMLESEEPDLIVDSFEDAEHLFQALDV